MSEFIICSVIYSGSDSNKYIEKCIIKINCTYSKSRSSNEITPEQ